MVTILKLGGSVVTEKEHPETVDQTAIDAASEEIARFLDTEAKTTGSDLVVVHGGGSFGHPAAAKHGVSSTEGTRDAAGLVEIHRAMGRLTDAILDSFGAAGVPALPVRPLSAANRNGAELSFCTDAVEAMLTEGFVPVLHGDVVVESGVGGTVLSGDTIVVSLASALDADRVGLCSTVPGVLDSEGAVIPEITSYDSVADVLGESEATDVTGGMAAKVHQLLELETPASIFDLDGLSEFFERGHAGTVVR